jgi:hypothetical protein
MEGFWELQNLSVHAGSPRSGLSITPDGEGDEERKASISGSPATCVFHYADLSTSPEKVSLSPVSRRRKSRFRGVCWLASDRAQMGPCFSKQEWAG